MTKLYTSLIAGAELLGKSITSFKKNYTTAHLEAQQIAVSAIVHAATHGDATYLNSFYAVLSSNDKDAFKNFTRRIFAVIGGWDGKTTVPQETMLEFKRLGEFLKIADGAFRVLRNDEGTGVLAAKTAMQVEGFVNMLLVPDGKTWKPFLDRNNFAETKVFGTDELQKALKSLITKARGDAKNVDSTVSDDMLAALVTAQTTIGEPATASRSLIN